MVAEGCAGGARFCTDRNSFILKHFCRGMRRADFPFYAVVWPFDPCWLESLDDGLPAKYAWLGVLVPLSQLLSVTGMQWCVRLRGLMRDGFTLEQAHAISALF